MAEQQTINTINGIDLDVLQQTVHAIEQDPELAQCRFRARNKWMGGTHNHTRISNFFAAGQERQHKQPFDLDADEPPMLAGEDEAPNPVEHLLNALAGCMTTSIAAHAAVRGIHIEELESELEGDLDLRGFLGLSPDTPRGFTHIRVKFKAKADTENMTRLRQLVEYSPVFNTITHAAKVDVQVEPK